MKSFRAQRKLRLQLPAKTSVLNTELIKRLVKFRPGKNYVGATEPLIRNKVNDILWLVGKFV